MDNMISVVDENGDGVVDRAEFHALVRMATLRATLREERGKSTILRKSLIQSKNKFDGSDSSDTDRRAKFAESKSEEKKVDDHSSTIRQRLPRTCQEALSPDSNDERAIIVTESKYPFNIVGVNEPWEDLCGYKSSEAHGKSMSGLIQGPKTNRKGLKGAMDRLLMGDEHVECTTVNYRKDGSMFTNQLIMGPLYDEADFDEEEGKREAAFYVGILINLGDLAQDLSAEIAEGDPQ